MNIAIILEATLGGIRKHVVDVITNLSSNYNITFIYSMRRADDHFKKDIQILKKSFDCVELTMSNVLYHPANLYSVFKLIKLFRSKKIQLVHVHGAVAGALGRLAALFCSSIQKIVYSPHGGVLHKIEASLSGKFYAKVENVLNTKKVFFVAVSIDEKEKIQRYFKVPNERVSLIPNGIDINYFETRKCDLTEIQAEKTRLSFNEQHFILLYPALFLEAKGHVNFFSTVIKNNLSLSSKVKILLAGDGPLLPSVKALIRNTKLEEHVIFLGYVKNIDLYFQLTDAVILPSVNEAFGYVLLEAMAYEKMIFATRVGGIKDIIIHDENGLLYGLDSLAEMIRDINKYAECKNGLKHFGARSKQILAEKFSITKTVQQIQETYMTDF